MGKNTVKSMAVVELNSCSNSCIFCNFDRVRRKVSGQELRNIEAHLMRQVLSLKKNGLDDYLEISGCDPIEFKKIVPFVEYLKKDLRFKTVELSTHGRNLHNLKLVDKLNKAGLDRLRVPLYGSCDAVHDSVTQEKGSFQETLKGIQHVVRRAPRIKMTITSLIMKQNYTDMSRIFLLACRYASAIVFSIPCISHMGQAKKFAISLEKMKPYLKILFEQSDRMKKAFYILDIPFCIFGFDSDNIINMTRPPIASSVYSVPAPFKSRISRLPCYRVKTKLPLCERCALNYKCDGFYNNYLTLFGSSRLEPLGFSAVREDNRFS